MTTLRVVIADDQPMMRAGFKAVLEATGDIQVGAEASNGEEAVRAAAANAPECPHPKSHVSHLLAKLGLRDRVQAVIYAYETRLISPSD